MAVFRDFYCKLRYALIASVVCFFSLFSDSRGVDYIAGHLIRYDCGYLFDSMVMSDLNGEHSSVHEITYSVGGAAPGATLSCYDGTASCGPLATPTNCTPNTAGMGGGWKFDHWVCVHDYNADTSCPTTSTPSTSSVLNYDSSANEYLNTVAIPIHDDEDSDYRYIKCCATWNRNYKVVYQNGDYGNNCAYETAETFEYSTCNQIPWRNCTSSNPGYTFTGWDCKHNNTTVLNMTSDATPTGRSGGGSGSSCTGTNKITWNTDDDLVCTAQFEAIPVTYNVDYNCNLAAGGSGTATDSNSPYSAGDSVTILSGQGNCTNSGNKVFTGWSCSDGTNSYSGTFNMPSSNITCTAVWENCVCTPGSNVNTCSVTGVANNQCQYSYECASNYHVDGKGNSVSSGTFEGDAGVESNTSGNCTVVNTPASTTTLTYECGPGSHAIMNPNTESVNVGGTYTIDSTSGNTHCQPDDNSWPLFAIRCTQGNNALCVGNNSDCYIGSMPAEGATCTIYYKDKNDTVEIIQVTDPCDDDAILATYYYVNGNYYSNYGSNGPSGQITEGTSLGGYPDNSCFIGFSFEQCFNDIGCSSTGTFALSHAVANSYGEWLAGSGYGDGPQDHTNGIPLNSVNLNSGHALRLSSVTADPVAHGTEFVWYCSAQDVADTSQQYTYSCNGGQQCTSGCYGHQVGLYPMARNLNCCDIGTYVNSNNNYHLGYQIDFSHPLNINNNSNNNIEIPTRAGYVFLGYYNTPDGQAGTQYVDANGNMTTDGLTAAANQINGMPAGVCAQWYAHWCLAGQTGNSNGTCSSGSGSGGSGGVGNCEEGYVLQNMNEYLNGESNGGQAYFGREFDYTEFYDGDSGLVSDLSNLLGGGSGGRFAVMFNQPKSVVGSAMCIKQEGDPSYLGDVNNTSEWLQLYQDLDTNPAEYCWCNLNGYSVDGNNIVNINNDNWILVEKFGDQAECETKCTYTCAMALTSGAEHVSEILETVEDCVPAGDYTVTYWCSLDDYEAHDSAKILTTDTVSDEQSYTPSLTQQELSGCVSNAAGYTVTGYTCFTDPSRESVDVGEMDPWTVGENVDCYPDLEPSIFTITLNRNGGTGGSGAVYSKYNTGVYLSNNNGNVSSQMTTSSNPITVPTRSGYVFLGYYLDANSNTQYIDNTGKITQQGINAGNAYVANATWVAKWEETNVIKYYGGTPAPVTSTVSGSMSDQTVDWDDDVTMNSNQFTAEGYTFNGWSCCVGSVSCASPVSYADGATIQGAQANPAYSDDLYCTAQWTINSHNVTYDCDNGGLGTNPSGVSDTYMSSITVPTDQSTCQLPTGNAVFSAWYCKKYGDDTVDVVIDDTDPANPYFNMPDYNVVCKAKWGYQVTYHSGNCIPAGSPSEITATDPVAPGQQYDVLYPSNLSPNVLSGLSGYATGCYSFDGWSKSGSTSVDIDCYANNVSSYCDSISSFNNATDSDLYAFCRWEKYDVVYHSGGCCTGNDYTDAAAAVVNSNYGILELSSTNVSAGTGCTFQGWSTTSGSSTVDYLPTTANSTRFFPVSFTGACPKNDVYQFNLYAVCSTDTYPINYYCTQQDETPSYTDTASAGGQYSIATTNVANCCETGKGFVSWSCSYVDGNSQTQTVASGDNVVPYTVNCYPTMNNLTADITYNPGAHGTSTGNNTVSDFFEYGQYYTLNSGNGANIAADTGYVFAGWASDSAGQNIICSASASAACDQSASPWSDITCQDACCSGNDTTVYAVYNCDTANGYHWNSGNTACVNTHDVTYNCNGGSGTAPQDSGSPYAPTVSVTVLSNTDSNTDEDYCLAPDTDSQIFDGWICSGQDGNNNTVEYPFDVEDIENEESFEMPLFDMTCDAQWDCDTANGYHWNSGNTACINTYTITYHQGSCVSTGEPTSTTAVYGTSYSVVGLDESPIDYAIFAPTGEAFVGWDTSSAGATVTYNVDDAYTVTGNLDLYAVCVPTHTIVYEPGTCGGSSTQFVNALTEGSAYTVLGLSDTDVTDNNGAFQGWSTSSVGNSVIYSAGSSISGSNINDDITLYAVCKYAVEYDCNAAEGGTGTAPQDSNSPYFVGASVTEYSGGRGNCTNSGNKVFAGWSCSDGTSTYDGTFSMPQNNVTCMAQWTACACTPGTNVATCVPNGTDYTNTCDYTYTCEANYNSGTNGSTGPTNVTGQAVAWTSPDCSPDEYTITYMNGDTVITGLTPATYAYDPNNAVALPADAGSATVPQGMEFGGWCAESDCSNGLVSSIPAGSVGNKTFYVNWGNYSGSIVYQCGELSGNGGSTSYTYGDTYTLVASPGNMCSAGTDDVFIGWDCSLELSSGSSANSPYRYVNGDSGYWVVNGSVTCTAQWTRKIHLNWNVDGGSMPLDSNDDIVSNPDACDMGTLNSINPIYEPTRSGYTFRGWAISDTQ